MQHLIQQEPEAGKFIDPTTDGRDAPPAISGENVYATAIVCRFSSIYYNRNGYVSLSRLYMYIVEMAGKMDTYATEDST